MNNFVPRNLGPIYTKKLVIVYQKFKFNSVSCIFMLNLAVLA